ncbi:uncharacterized protein BYT42DRAFT_187732 [Radiomyces spectabilis]|uniref:uncharacterized protein n=1 Tax=Radiomyces spectabilis TaxID=64574 RepID=UPI00221F4115|nr:uncharacterized protein BYT42DRAFT_187732 [Radiomyces spectabilis]KAI8391258.1 hypothetical protein BYT42DRAFT_187732 [Radiomyces spectabilis]
MPFVRCSGYPITQRINGKPRQLLARAPSKLSTTAILGRPFLSQWLPLPYPMTLRCGWNIPIPMKRTIFSLPTKRKEVHATKGIQCSPQTVVNRRLSRGRQLLKEASMYILKAVMTVEESNPEDVHMYARHPWNFRNSSNIFSKPLSAVKLDHFQLDVPFLSYLFCFPFCVSCLDLPLFALRVLYFILMID